MRKIIISIVLLVILIAGFFVAFWPKQQSITIMIYATDLGISDKNFTDYVTSNPGTHIFYFYSVDDDNCDYVNNTILKSLAENLLTERLDNMILVDLSKASTTAKAKFYRQWGFTQYPAFAIIESDLNDYKVISSLGYSEEKPFNTDDVKEWLIDNEIWQAWLASN